MFDHTGAGLIVGVWDKKAMSGQVYSLPSPDARPVALATKGIPLAVSPAAPLLAILESDKSKEGQPLFASGGDVLLMRRGSDKTQVFRAKVHYVVK